jgi:hypothetical protein
MLVIEPDLEALPWNQQAPAAAIVRKDVNILPGFGEFNEIPKISWTES